MGRHVPAVRNQGHGPEDAAADDLGHHHGCSYRNDGPRPALMAIVFLAQEHVLVTPLLKGVTVHW